MARRPCSSPHSPKSPGAAQMAATHFPWRAKASTARLTSALCERFCVPRSPPGSTTMPYSSSGTFSARASAVTVMPCEPCTQSEVLMLAVVTSAPARRSRSTGMRASPSSKPSARNTHTFSILLFLLSARGMLFFAGKAWYNIRVFFQWEGVRQ